MKCNNVVNVNDILYYYASYNNNILLIKWNIKQVSMECLQITSEMCIRDSYNGVFGSAGAVSYTHLKMMLANNAL